MLKYLNLGSGEDYKESSEEIQWINADISTNVKTDIVMDGFRVPYVFKDEEFDGVLAQDFLEHIPHTLFGESGLPLSGDGFILVMNELWRILKPGGMLESRFPHPHSANSLIDPTHTRVLFPETFIWYFCKDQPFSFYTDKHWAKFVSGELDYGNIGINMFKVS